MILFFEKPIQKIGLTKKQVFILDSGKKKQITLQNHGLNFINISKKRGNDKRRRTMSKSTQFTQQNQHRKKFSCSLDH